VTDIVYLSGEDFASQIAYQIKAILLECPELIIAMPGFTQDMTGANILQFPEIGVLWNTVTLTGNVGNYTPQVFTTDGLTARLNFATTQTGAVTVNNYSRASSYILANINDLQTNLFTYFGDPNIGSKMVNHVPVVVPLVNRDKTKLVRYAAGCEVVQVHGVIAIYGGSDQGSIQNVKLEAAKFYRFVRAYKFLFSQKGLTQAQFEMPDYSIYKDSLYEAAIPFTAMVTLQPAPQTTEVPFGTTLPPTPV